MRFVILVLALSGTARADRCADITAALRADAHDDRVYRWSWAAGNGALAIGLGVDGAVADDPTAYVGAAGSVIAAALPFLLGRLPAIDDLDCDNAEALLARTAANERAARGPWAHIVNVAINAAGWLVVGLVWHRWKLTGLGALASVGLGEVEIYTRPTAALSVSF